MTTIEEILTIKGPDVIVTSPDTTVSEAASLMTQANVGSVIVKSDNDVMGIFTERDVLQRVVAKGKEAATTRLDEVMSAPVQSCSLNDDVSQVAIRLSSEHIRHLAVIEDGALIGLVGLRDVLAAEIREKDRTIRQLHEVQV